MDGITLPKWPPHKLYSCGFDGRMKKTKKKNDVIGHRNFDTQTERERNNIFQTGHNLFHVI